MLTPLLTAGITALALAAIGLFLWSVVVTLRLPPSQRRALRFRLPFALLILGAIGLRVALGIEAGKSAGDAVSSLLEPTLDNWMFFFSVLLVQLSLTWRVRALRHRGA